MANAPFPNVPERASRPVSNDVDLEVLAALSESTRSLGLGDDLEELLDDILRQAQKLIGFEHCVLLLFEQETEVLVARKALGYGHDTAIVLGRRLRPGEGVSGWAVQNRQAVRVGDVRQDPRYLEGFPGTRSTLSVPLIVGEEVAGVITLESPRHDAFNEVHEHLLAGFGTQAALAIIAHQARDRLQQRVEHLDALYRISQLASVTVRDDFDRVLRAVLEATQEIVPEGHCALLLLDPASACLRVQASEGYQAGVERLLIPLGKGVTGRAAKLGETQVVDDLDEEDAYLPGVPGARSEIALPLVAEGQVLGVLNIESKQPYAYNEAQVRILKMVARQLAVVLRTAQLHAEARRLSITDPLTGLHNRRHFLRQLDESIRRAQRYDRRLALVFVDLDRFKSINDSHGHYTGDLALIAVADAMRESMRDTDVLARLGGEEFAALLIETDRDRALQVAERFQTHVRNMGFRADTGELVSISLSAGIAMFPEHGDEPAALLRGADAALYAAKRRGRSQIVVGDDDAQPHIKQGAEKR